jgi:hypothetical protein
VDGLLDFAFLALLELDGPADRGLPVQNGRRRGFL